MNTTPVYIVTGIMPIGCTIIFATTDYEEAKERYLVAIRPGYYDDICNEILLVQHEGDSKRLLLEHSCSTPDDYYGTPTNQPYKNKK